MTGTCWNDDDGVMILGGEQAGVEELMMDLLLTSVISVSVKKSKLLITSDCLRSSWLTRFGLGSSLPVAGPLQEPLLMFPTAELRSRAAAKLLTGVEKEIFEEVESILASLPVESSSSLCAERWRPTNPNWELAVQGIEHTVLW